MKPQENPFVAQGEGRDRAQAQSPEFTSAMTLLSVISPDGGRNRPEWKTNLLTGLLQDLQNEAHLMFRNPLTYVTMLAAAVTIFFKPEFSSQVAEQRGSWYDNAVKLSHRLKVDHPRADNILKSLADEAVVADGGSLRQWNQPSVVNAGLTIGYMAQGALLILLGGRFASAVYMRYRRKEGREQGTQPLWNHESPELVVLGPTDTGNSVLKLMLENRTPSRFTPAVSVHVEEDRPPKFGLNGFARYHFKLDEGSNVYDPGQIHAIGLDRARQIVAICCDEDRALFYGDGGCADFTPADIGVLLSNLSELPSEMLRSREIAVVLPKDITLLGGTASVTAGFKEYREALAEKGATLKVIHPEDVLLEEIEKDLQGLPPGAAAGKRKVAIVGGKDAVMLENFKKAMCQRFPEVEIQIVSSVMLGNVKGEAYTQLTKAERELRTREILSIADRVYVYPDKDSQVSLLAQMAYGQFEAQCDKLVCIVELPQYARIPQQRELNYICVYEKVVERIKASEAASLHQAV